jgi:hypothetical protein
MIIYISLSEDGLSTLKSDRLKRAREMGFDTEHIYYHSSLENIDSFNPVGQFMGYTGTSGISVTDNPAMASRYLDRYCNTRYDGVLFEKHVMPLFIKKGKVLERDEPFKQNLRLGAPLPKDYVPIFKKMGYDTLVRNDAISKGGTVKHSSAKNAIRGKEYVLASPSQLRSIFAIFDPKLKDSANLLA